MTLNEQLFEAVSFAARAHRHELRKDGKTPYSAHTFRVCLVVRQVFGIDDPKVLMTALLHDTIEDTPTDYDDVAKQFGPDVAGWVAALTKDMRLEETPREEDYQRALRQSDWPVTICKLADLFDNLTDSRHLTVEQRARTIARSTSYLESMRPTLKPQAEAAFAIVEQLIAKMRSA